MTFAIAFISGISVCAASIVVPHARSSKNTVEEFRCFQNTLATLPIVSPKNRQK